MATGAIIGCTIESHGITATITVEGFASGTKTYNYTASPPTFTVVSKGYSGTSPTTVTRTVKAVKSFALATSGNDLLVTVELDRPIYQKDSTSGSGTAPLLGVASGWITRASPYSDSTSALTSYTPTQSSTLAYPKPVARWATPPCRREVDTWHEEVAAYAMHAENSYPFGVAAVTFRVTDSLADYAEVTATAPTMVARSSTGYGPAANYPLWRVSFDADHRTPTLAFEKGPATRHFKVYPRIGDAVFDTSTESEYDVRVGVRMEELYLDPGDSEGTALNASKVYVDSTWEASYADSSGTFVDREFALVDNGSTRQVVKIVTGRDSSSKVRFNFLEDEEVYTIAVSTTVTPQPGDLMYLNISDVVRLGLVLKYASGVVTFHRLSSTQFASGDSGVTFLYRSGVGSDYIARGATTFSITGNPSSVGGGTSFPGGTVTGFTSLATRTGVGAATAAGNNGNNGLSSGAAKDTIYNAMVKAVTDLSPENKADGCTVILLSGDYPIGPGGATDLSGSGTEPGHWTHIVPQTDHWARIVRYGASAPGIGLRRTHLKGLTLWNAELGNLMDTPSDPPNYALWVDECTLSGPSSLAGLDFVRLGSYPALFYTSSRASSTISGMGIAKLVRDCECYDVAGDCFSKSSAVINASADLCTRSGNTALHGDIGQWEGNETDPSTTNFQNIVWQNIYARRLSVHQLCPNVGGQSGTRFLDVALVNMVQVAPDDRPHGVSAPTIKNLLIWNCTFDSDFGFGNTDGTIESISIESCCFDQFRLLSTTFGYSGWFRNNHYRDVSGTYKSPGTHVSTGGTRDDLFVNHTDATQSAYYAPEGALVEAFDNLEMKVGTDMYGTPFNTADIGGIAS